MQIGRIKFVFDGNGTRNGLFYRGDSGVEQNVTIPALAILGVALVLFCCCARALT